MAALVTQNFRIHNAKQFREMFDETELFGGTSVTDAQGLLNTNIYMFIGKSDAWSGSFSDTNVPNPATAANPSSDTTANTSYTHWKDMIAAKKVASSDVSHVVTRHNWALGNHYVMYDHTETMTNLLSERTGQTISTGTGTLYPVYVMNSNFNVYKCLHNNKSVAGVPQPSTVEPTAVTTTAGAPAALGDGYVWKYMYSISASDALKFVTSGYIPVKQLRDANALGNTATAGGLGSGGTKNDGSDQATIEYNAVDGALDVFVISNAGTGYHFEDNISIASGAGTSLVLTSPGLTASNRYTNSSVYFTFSGSSYVRKVTASSYSAPNMTLTLDSTLGTTLSGTLTANVAPWPQLIGDGHGQELVLTSGTTANTVGGVTVINSGNSFTTATLNVSAQNEGGSVHGTGAVITPIIPPKGGHGYDPVTELGGYFIMINTKLTQDESGTFTTTNDFRKIGLLADPNNDSGYTKYIGTTGTQAKTFTYSSADQTIDGDIILNQNTVGANGATAYVVDVNTAASTMRVIDITNGANTSAGYDGKPGSWQCTTANVASGFGGSSSTISKIFYTNKAGSAGTATLTNVANGVMQIGSGDVIYIENRAPVARASDQTEDIKLIIEF